MGREERVVGLLRWILNPVRRWFRPTWRRIEWRRRSGTLRKVPASPMRLDCEEASSETSPEVSLANYGASDAVEVRLDDLVISVARATSSTLPHEITVVVPRAEIYRRYEDGKLAETRIVYSSVTVSHAPRFPPTQP
ncbi:MAG TPA: hypothetical protein GXX23_01795 [Firmicutes bacterium]|nr:hypothetical protein [Candidatus Fermentithermobacillaceae bacterium]